MKELQIYLENSVKALEHWILIGRIKAENWHPIKRKDRSQPFNNILHPHTHRDTGDFSICVLHGGKSEKLENKKRKLSFQHFSLQEEGVENVYVNFEMQRIEKVFHARHVAHSAISLTLILGGTQVFPACVCVCEKHKIQENCSRQSRRKFWDWGRSSHTHTHSTIIAGNGSAKCCCCCCCCLPLLHLLFLLVRLFLLLFELQPHLKLQQSSWVI